MRRQTFLLMATFLGLAVASYVAVQQEPSRGMVRLRLTSVPMAEADHITITQGTASPLELTRTTVGAPWVITGGHHADGSRVARLLTALGAVNTSDMITQDTGRFSDFNVEGDKAYDLRVQRNSRDLAHLRIGEAEAPHTCYLRDGDTVFRAQGELSYAVTGQAADWEDRNLPTPDVAVLTSLTVAAVGQPPLGLRQTLAPVGDNSNDAANSDALRVWAPQNASQLPVGMRFDAGAASALARTLSDLHADHLIDQDPGDAVTKLSSADAISWTVADADAEHVLRLGAPVPEHPSERFAQVDGAGQLYSVASTTAAALLKTWNDLRDLSLMAAADFGNVQSVALRFPGAKAAMTFTKAQDGTFAVSRAGASKTFAPDSVKVRVRTQQALLARAIKFEGPQKPQHGFKNSTTGAFAATMADKTVHTLEFGRALKASEGVGYFARGSAGKDVYVVSKALHDTLMGGPDTLSKKPLPQQINPQVAAPASPGLTPEMEAQIRAQMAAQAAG